MTQPSFRSPPQTANHELVSDLFVIEAFQVAGVSPLASPAEIAHAVSQQLCLVEPALSSVDFWFEDEERTAALAGRAPL